MLLEEPFSSATHILPEVALIELRPSLTLSCAPAVAATRTRRTAAMQKPALIQPGIDYLPESEGTIIIANYVK